MQYNAFGCNVNDIVSYYHGTTLTDYSTNSLSGTDVILSELDYSEMTVLEAIPSNFASVLQNGIPYVQVWDGQSISISGVALSNLKEAIQVDDREIQENKIGCSSYRCPGSTSSLTDSSETITITNGIVSITNYDSEKDYFSKMEFTSDVVLTGLKKVIRELTACRLGSQLFSRGSEDEWTSVKRACEDSAKLLEAIKDPYWMPYELKKLKYYNGTSPIKTKNGLYSIRVSRS